MVSDSCPAPEPGVPHDSRYLPSGEKIQNTLSNEAATQMFPLTGSIAGCHVSGCDGVGPPFSQRSLSAAKLGEGLGTGLATAEAVAAGGVGFVTAVDAWAEVATVATAPLSVP